MLGMHKPASERWPYRTLATVVQQGTADHGFAPNRSTKMRSWVRVRPDDNLAQDPATEGASSGASDRNTPGGSRGKGVTGVVYPWTRPPRLKVAAVRLQRERIGSPDPSTRSIMEGMMQTLDRNLTVDAVRAAALDQLRQQNRTVAQLLQLLQQTGVSRPLSSKAVTGLIREGLIELTPDRQLVLRQ